MAALSTLLVFWAAFGLAVASPGPNFAVLLATATRAGRPEAVRTAIGMAGGELVWGSVAVFGLAALTQAHPWILPCLRIGGGAFLLWLGVQSLRAAMRHGNEAGPAAAGVGSMARGFGVMLVNPKAAVLWMSLAGLPIGLDITTTTEIIAVGGAVLMSLVWHFTLALALSAQTVGRFYRQVRRGLDAALGVVLAGLGLRLLASP